MQYLIGKLLDMVKMGQEVLVVAILLGHFKVPGKSTSWYSMLSPVFSLFYFERVSSLSFFQLK